MKTRLRAFAFGLCLVLLTGCVNIVEEVFLKKDGSGRFVLTFDMSSIIGLRELDMFRMKTLGRADSARSSLEKYDSVIHFSHMADSIKRRWKHPELIVRANAKIRVDEKNGIMELALEFPFTRIEEINEFLEDILRSSQDSVRQKGNNPFLAYVTTFKGSKGSIERSTTFLKPEEEDKFASLTKAFLAAARVKTIYHLPRKVKHTTIEGALVDGNQCQLELTYPEFISGRKSLDGKIVFR